MENLNGVPRSTIPAHDGSEIGTTKEIHVRRGGGDCLVLSN